MGVGLFFYTAFEYLAKSVASVLGLGQEDLPVLRLRDGTKLSLTEAEIRNDMFQFGVRVALRFLRSKFWGEEDANLYGRAGRAFRVGLWSCCSSFYGEGVSVPFAEREIRSALLPEPEHWEAD